MAFLDIGLRIECKNHLDAVKIFVPFPVSVPDIVDLGAPLKAPKVLVAIFNEDYSVITETDESWFGVSDHAG